MRALLAKYVISPPFLSTHYDALVGYRIRDGVTDEGPTRREWAAEAKSRKPDGRVETTPGERRRSRMSDSQAHGRRWQLDFEELNERFATAIAQHEEEVASLCMAVEVVKVWIPFSRSCAKPDTIRVQDAVARPGLLGTVRNKVAQVYKGVGGYLPQSPAVHQTEVRTAVVRFVTRAV